jgi:hypothetical protein
VFYARVRSLSHFDNDDFIEVDLELLSKLTEVRLEGSSSMPTGWCLQPVLHSSRHGCLGP